MNPQQTPREVPHRMLFHDMPCRFCCKSICPMGHHSCLHMVTPESAVEAVFGLLDEVKFLHGQIRNQARYKPATLNAAFAIKGIIRPNTAKS